jgi:hypothetical protein
MPQQVATLVAMSRYIFGIWLWVVVTDGALRRPEKPAAKVQHLVQDIEESISKAGEDSEMVFATLYTYDGQLESSLKKEVATLIETSNKLIKMQNTYSADINNSHVKFADLGASAHDSAKLASKYEKGTALTNNKFQGLQDNIKMLVALLKNAGVTPQGSLVTPEVPDKRGEPARVYSAVRRLLGANAALKDQHQAVYDAFLPSKVKRAPAGTFQYPVVHMTQGLLEDTIKALTAVKSRLGSMKAEALLQFDSLHRRFEKQAVFAGANAQAQLGLEAENEQKAAELTFSIRFTNAVLKIDKKFYETVQAHVKSNADLIYSVRDLRQAQLKILRDLSGILSAEGSIAAPSVSFLEMKSETAHTSLSGLPSEVENLIQSGGDTHALLMRVKDMLDDNSPIDAGNVRNTMMEMEDALRKVEGAQPKFDEAKRGCESQKFHANEEEDSLKANLALMTAAQDHAQKAIKAAATNVKGIEKKAQALDKSSTDFTRISMQAIKTLEGQSHDRKTIMMAVKKAIEVVGPTLPAGASTVQLMQSLLQDIMAQETKEEIYRANQQSFQSEFLRYVQDYTQLLQERRRHYESSLGVLQLHVSELASDLLAQQQTLGTGHELSLQSQGLCESVLKFYEKHTRTRADLSKTLRSIIPNMPTVLSAGAIDSPTIDA